MNSSPLSLRRAAILGESIKASAMPETEGCTTIIQFGHCQLFANRRDLIVDGVPASLGNRAFDVLRMLVAAGGKLVTKDEILSGVWPGIIVEENTLQVQITRVRRALGQDRGFLKTVSRRGYRFVAEVTKADQEPEAIAPAAATTEALAHAPNNHTNLPAVASLLLDRQAELSEVVRLVAAHRLVTLTGAGGIGKTSLALEAARHLQSELPDGAWLVELGPLTDPGLVSVTIATALGLTLPADTSLDDLAHSLDTKHLLIVLDNCEHVIEAAASVTERLVRGTPAVRVLATSREPLRADGEQVYQVPCLNVPWINALQMAEHLANVDYQLRAPWGLWACHLARGEYPNTLALADRFAQLAQRQSDPTDALVGERMKGSSLLYLGNQTGARYHFDRWLDQYVPPVRRSHSVRFQFDQQIVARLTLARTLWLQGLPDQALHLARSSIEDARAIDHGVSLAYALAFGACPVAFWVGDLSAAEHFVTLLRDVSTRPGLRGWNDWVRYFEGVLAIGRGDGDSGLPLMRGALDTLGARTIALQSPAFMGEFAAALGLAGQVDEGLAAIEAALARWRRDSGLWCEPELLRINGELRLLHADTGAARAAQELFSQGLDCAHTQGALSWELRCATSLSRLWRNEHRIQDAYLVLAPILARFKEGFASADLITARVLLDELR